MPHRPEGLLLLYKPEGPTSHDLVASVRRAVPPVRVGHAGTLDPLASGLLPLVLGRATRLVRFLPASPKIYEGTLELGYSTDTDDVTGAVISRHAGALPPAAEVRATAGSLEGRGPQVPPAFSARKVEGRRLYELARKGVAVTATPAEVLVERFELAATDRSDRFAFRAEVSGGTYVRALVRDLGRALGCGAALASLRRTAIGPMRLEDALVVPPGGPDRRSVLEALIPLERMPLEPPPFRVDDAVQAERFTQGVAILVGEGRDVRGLVRVHHPTGALLGVAEGRDGLLHPRVVLQTGG